MDFKKRVNGSWVDTPNYIYNTFTDTITTLPIVIYTNDTTATVGLKGNMEQSSTPTPDNPIQPQETGERTLNLFDKSTISSGHFAVTTGIRENSLYYCSDFIPITATTYYFQNVVGSSYQNAIVVYDANKHGLRYEKLLGSTEVSGAISFQSGDAYIRINCYYQTDVNTVMINKGSTALPYEPYGYKIPISSANTTTPIYLGEMQSTRQIKKLVLTGTDSDGITNATAQGIIQITPLPTLKNVRNAYCTHYEYVDQNQGSSMPNNSFTTSGGGGSSLWFKTEYTTATDFKAYLAAQYANGTPVTIWYVLAEPETAVVNEPLRKIGDYADTVSGITIPTITGTNTIDVETTLKPSEVSVNYHGWHPVSALHRFNGTSWD